jgi:hypothetical protein
MSDYRIVPTPPEELAAQRAYNRAYRARRAALGLTAPKKSPGNTSTGVRCFRCRHIFIPHRRTRLCTGCRKTARA